MKSLKEIMSENVRYYRKLKGISQLDLAYEIKISPSYLNDVEHGRQYISMKMLERLADFFGVKAYVLLVPQNNDERNITTSEYKSELLKIQTEINQVIGKRLER